MARDQRTIELLEAYLDLARAGRLQWFASVAVDTEGSLLVARHGRIDRRTWNELMAELHTRLFGPHAKVDLRLVLGGPPDDE